MNKIKTIKSTIFGLLLVILLSTISSAATVKTDNQTVKIGQQFNINVSVDPQSISLAGVQADLSYNSSVIHINNISEGNLLTQTGFSTFFNHGIIDNMNGSVKNTFDVIIGAHNDTNVGTYIVINATALNPGNANLAIQNTILSDPNGTSIPVTIVSGNVVVTSKYDVNQDGVIDIKDLILISQNLGTNNPQYDINNDGIVDIRDLVIVAQYIAG